MQQMFRDMLDLQNNVNTTVDPVWRQEQREWGRAIWRECAELLDEFNWEWWKDNSPMDAWNVQIELADIWAFGLSHQMQSRGMSDEVMEGTAELLMQIYKDNRDAPAQTDKAIFLLEQIAAAGCNGKFNPGMFFAFCNAMYMTLEQLHRVYCAKSALNNFRQNNGYGDGTYQKEWAPGVEDNAYLQGLVQEHMELEPADPDDSEAPSDHPYDFIYDRLGELYFIVKEEGELHNPKAEAPGSGGTQSPPESPSPTPEPSQQDSALDDTKKAGGDDGIDFGDTLDPADSGQ